MKKTKINMVNIIVLVVMAVLPFFVAQFFIGRNPLTSFFPSPVFGDETGYYRVTKSFVEYKNFGNYGVSYTGDVAAKYGGFSAHGPKYVVLYGLLGKIFGFEPYSLLIFNLCILSVAFIIFVLTVKPDIKQGVLISVAFYSFFPFLYFLVSGMVETFQYSLILVYAAIFYCFYKKQSQKTYLLLLAFVFFMTLFRINYFILYYPFIILYRKNNKKMLVVDIIITLILSVVSYVFIGLMSAPYPSYLDEIIGAAFSLKIGKMISLMFSHAGEVIKTYFNYKSLSVYETAFNYIYVIVSAVVTVIGIIKATREKKINLTLLCGGVMILELLILFFLYESIIFKATRTLGVFLVLPILMLTFSKKKIKYVVVILLFVFNLALSGGYNDYKNNARYTITNEPIVTMQNEIDDLFSHIKYDKTGDRWKNTIAVNNSLSYNMNAMIGFPSYVGLNYVLTNDFSSIEKCEYLLVDENTIVNTDKYAFITDSSFGKLYKHK